MKPSAPRPAQDGPPRPGARTDLRRTKSGKLVSKRSRTGDPACSQAMSDWKTKGMSPAIAAVLGKCRARARLQGKATDHANAGREGMAANLQRRSEGQYVTVKERLARAKEIRAERTTTGRLSPGALAAGERLRKAAEYDRRAPARAKAAATRDSKKQADQARIDSYRRRGLDQTVNEDVRRLARAKELRAQRAAKPAPATEQPAAYSVLRPRTQALLASVKALRAKHGSDGIAHAKDLRDTARNTENALYSQRDNAGARRYARVASRAASLATDSPKGGFYGDAGLAQWRAKRTPYKLERGTATPAPSLREIAAKPDAYNPARVGARMRKLGASGHSQRVRDLRATMAKAYRSKGAPFEGKRLADLPTEVFGGMGGIVRAKAALKRARRNNAPADVIAAQPAPRGERIPPRPQTSVSQAVTATQRAASTIKPSVKQNAAAYVDAKRRSPQARIDRVIGRLVERSAKSGVSNRMPLEQRKAEAIGAYGNLQSLRKSGLRTFENRNDFEAEQKLFRSLTKVKKRSR
jgi:hypothetical protein